MERKKNAWSREEGREALIRVWDDRKGRISDFSIQWRGSRKKYLTK